MGSHIIATATAAVAALLITACGATDPTPRPTTPAPVERLRPATVTHSVTVQPADDATLCGTLLAKAGCW